MPKCQRMSLSLAPHSPCGPGFQALIAGCQNHRVVILSRLCVRISGQWALWIFLGLDGFIGHEYAVVILGAGFGGLELMTRLSEALADQVHITLIDQSDSFVFGFSKLDVMFGHRHSEEVRLYYRDIVKPNVEFKEERVDSIDPVERRVTTDAGIYEADVLVIALGADLDPAATPGLLEGGHEFYSVEGAERSRDVLPGFESGVAVIALLGPFLGPARWSKSPRKASLRTWLLGWLVHSFS